jgi:nucleotidyltransferase substrate binding protein (TIGR01987 family)
MDNENIRWRQRFQNFEKTLLYLQEAMQIKDPDIFQAAGVIHFFEMAFELSWNVVKDYLEEQGFDDIKSPRSSLKKAFEIGLIKDGENWLKLLSDRNLTSHTYDDEKVREVIALIHERYYPLMNQLYNTFNQKQNEQ